ncbi:MAG: endonuclease [Paludibacter sp.]|nr:endonuclease [Paludibacter sp.]
MYKSRYIFLPILFLFVLSTVFAAIPSGYYYFAKNKKKAELKTALHTYCGPMFEFDYGGGAGFTWQGFYSTDNRNDTVVDMYSNTIRKFNGFAAVDGMHIEHFFPKSWWGGQVTNAYKDLFHLYPADAITNITKSNLPLGEVTGTPTLDNGVTKIGANGFETAYTDNCFEPADEYKGDFARSYFYISTIYEDYANLWQSPMMNNNIYPGWKPWALDLLMKWNKQDPVSPKELARIEAIYNIQGNRNPFIDYPDLPDYIWGVDSTKVYPFPDETEAFLLTPRRGASMDFGVILVNNSRTTNIHFQGVNLNTDILVSLTGNAPSLALSTPTISLSNALNGVDLGITFSPTTSGSIRDTLLVQGGGLVEAIRIPIKALATSNFITLEPEETNPVGGTLEWISDPLATDYKLSLYQGDTQAGDLIISTYVEGTSYNKAIELYNGTGNTIDLSKYSLQRQTDGSGNFGSTIQLSGTLPTNQSYVIANNNYRVNAELTAKAQRTDSLINFNGNDAVALLRSGVIIDMVGPADVGAAVLWGMDMTLQRKSTVTHPLTLFNSSEWNSFSVDTWSFLGSHSMDFATSNNYILQNISTGTVTSYPVQGLVPQNTYTYKVESVRSGGNVPAVNTMQLHTSPLDIPILMEATNIHSTDFTANWEETLYATGYLVDVFKLEGQADTTVTEGFDSVGDKGTPLPIEWSGTASGNYTSTTSSGLTPPSVGLKNDAEWLQTKRYPLPIKNLTFMYRFASTATGSSVGVYGLSNEVWTRIDSITYSNTTKTNPVYTFTESQDMKAFRIIYHKTAGNLAIDDVSVTYGNQSTIYVQKDIAVGTSQAVISGLAPTTTYNYNVRATLGTAVSLASETISIQTKLSNKLSENNASSIKIFTGNDKIKVSGLQGNELIKVYSLTGICLKQVKANSSEINIDLKQSGIFIVQIQNGDYSFARKLIK